MTHSSHRVRDRVSPAHVLWRTLGLDRRGGWAAMAFVVVLVVAGAVVVLVLRAAQSGGPGGGRGARRTRPRPQRAGRPVAPDDDHECRREQARRTRGDDGSPA